MPKGHQTVKGKPFWQIGFSGHRGGDAGADVVMTATGAMWNGYLAKEIKEAYPDA